MMIANRRAEILLIEDEASDIALAREAMSGLPALNLHVVSDGTAGRDFLRRLNGYERAPRPDVVLLDLNLPGIDGRELLAEIKQDAELVEIPVVVLSASSAPSEIQRAYRRCANAYIVKPFAHDKLVAIVRAVTSFWIETARLPPHE